MPQNLLTPIIFVALMIGGNSHAAEPVHFTDQDIAIMRSFGPWPVTQKIDKSNRFSGQEDAISLGRDLFFNPIISGGNQISCASCHAPERAFGDDFDRSTGLARVDRNSISLANVRLNRWFGWDGRSDNLWAQSIHPILDSREMGADVAEIQTAILNNDQLLQQYLDVTGEKDIKENPDIVLVNIAKILAAFQETIVTPPTEFDRFIQRFVTSGKIDPNYSTQAQRGLKIFIGDANCFVCHFGPNFTNGEFSNNALPHFVDGNRVDAGRYNGILKYRDDPYKKSGQFSDLKEKNAETGLLENVKLLPRNWGEFRVPSLRNISKTAPYMHNGSLATLRDVILHYSTINEDRLHTDGENILKPLGLEEEQITDLIAFLKTLDADPTYFGPVDTAH